MIYLKLPRYIIVVSTTFLLVNCDRKISDNFLLNNSLPDEFAVVRRKPLSVPPDFALRPLPAQITRDSLIATIDTHKETKILLGGLSTVNNSNQVLSIDDHHFLSILDNENSLQDIRQIIAQENNSHNLVSQKSLIKKIVHLFIGE